MKPGLEPRMKVLIASTNSFRQPSVVLPYGACLVADAVSRAGHEVRFLDLLFEKNPLETFKKELDRFLPNVVGFSVRNIDNNDMNDPIAFYESLKPLAEAVRKRTGTRLVLGGAACSVMPEALLRNIGADCVVWGNGETVFPDLLQKWIDGESGKNVPGTGWIINGVYRRNESAAPDERHCVSPDYGRWVRLKKYREHLANVPLKTKWGCPFECVYCTYSFGEGKGYRLAPAREVVNAVRELASQGTRDVEFVDNVFNAPYDHALEICEALAEARLPVKYHTLELNPRSIDDRLLNAMEAAGFAGIGITAESVADPVLRSLGKNYTARDVEQAADAVRRHKVPCMWIFMLGGPGETRDTVRQTLEFAREKVRKTDSVFFNLGVRIYPETKLESIARTEELLDVPKEKMLSPVFYLSPKIDKAWIEAEVRSATEKNFNFLSGSSLALPFLSTIYRAAYHLGVRPPLWKHTRHIRRGLGILGIRS